MLNWLKKFKEPYIEYQIRTDLSDISEEQLFEHVRELTRSGHWPYFEEKLLRMRNFHLAEMVMATDEPTHNRLRGKIKTLDWVLSLSKNLV